MFIVDKYVNFKLEEGGIKMMQEINTQGGVPLEVQYSLMKDQMNQDKRIAEQLLESGEQATEQILHQNRANSGQIDILA